MAEDIKPTETADENTESVLDLQDLDTEDAEVEAHSCVSVLSVTMAN